MCRFLVVKATEPVLLADLTTKPVHSIINQSRDARLRLDGGGINADGFGVGERVLRVDGVLYRDGEIAGWYDANEDTASAEPDLPCIFQSITPAWSNRNLHRLAGKIRSPLIFAHVRASTTGVLSEENCKSLLLSHGTNPLKVLQATHGFTAGQGLHLLWMHNGGIAEFDTKIKRKLQSTLEDEYFAVPQGNTDSEWSFALFLQILSRRADPHAPTFSHHVLRASILDTIAQLSSWSKQAGVAEPSLLNFAVTDGKSVVATRYVSSLTEQAASLYFSTGTAFSEVEPGSGHYRMRKVDKREHIILIASEPLTFERDDWLEVANQTCVVITNKMNLLQYPILDEYHQDVRSRDHGLAASKGLYHFDHPPRKESTLR